MTDQTTCGAQFRADDLLTGPDQTCARPAGHDDALGHAPVRFPAGTPEHAAYVELLRVELVKFARREAPYDVDELADARPADARRAGLAAADAAAEQYAGTRPRRTTISHLAADLVELADALNNAPYGRHIAPTRLHVSFHVDAESSDRGPRCTTVDQIARTLLGRYGQDIGAQYSVSGDHGTTGVAVYVGTSLPADELGGQA